ncbi:MAG TPA: ABC transporter permease, partial [Chthonomonadales bacterium]|nr:ABC transporter permease [Chthonomonadales bacterium]
MTNLYLITIALKDLARPKKLIAALFLMAIPVGLALLWRIKAGASLHPEDAYNSLAAAIVFGLIMPILCVVFGTGVITQEIEQKTITYLLTRPVRRWNLLLVKYAAAAAATTAVVWLASAALALTVGAPHHLHGLRLGRDMLILPVGALAYTSLFLLLATILNKPLICGMFFVFGFETWVPDLPGDMRKLSIMTYLRVLAPH